MVSICRNKARVFRFSPLSVPTQLSDDVFLDGIFWISYEDLLKKYQIIDRTRIFGPEWNVTQCWTSVSVSWSAEYHSTKFSLTLEEKAPVVIVLAQLDDTYFRGLGGAYVFDLQFRLESDDKGNEDDYILRSNANYAMARSVSTDIELEAGKYSVLMRITATRHTDRDHVEDSLPVYAATRREKLIQMGLSYDLAHAKGVIVETDAEKKERKERHKAQKIKDRQKLKQKLKRNAEKDWKKRKERHEKGKAREARINQWRDRKKMADRKNGDSGANGVTHDPNSVDGQVAKQDGDVERNQNQNTAQHIGQGQAGNAADLPIRRKDDNVGDFIHNMGGFESPPPAEGPLTEEVVGSLEDVIKVPDEQEDKEMPPIPEAHQAPPAPEADVSATEDKPAAKPSGVDTTGSTRTVTIATDEPAYLSYPSNAPVARSGNAPESLAHIATNNKPSRPPPRSDTLNTTAAMVGVDTASAGASDDEGTENGIERRAAELQRPHNADVNDGAISDVDSFPPFDWDSELDMPSESSDSDDSAPSPPARGRRRGRRGARRRRQAESPDDKPDDDGEGPDEPWNAVCVVGLRVYSTLSGEKVKLKVVRPLDDDDDSDSDSNGEDGRAPNGGDEKRNEESEAAGTKLDPDDISKGAVAVLPESTGVEVDEGGKTEFKKGEEMRLGRTAGMNAKGRMARSRV